MGCRVMLRHTIDRRWVGGDGEVERQVLVGPHMHVWVSAVLQQSLDICTRATGATTRRAASFQHHTLFKRSSHSLLPPSSPRTSARPSLPCAQRTADAARNHGARQWRVCVGIQLVHLRPTANHLHNQLSCVGETDRGEGVEHRRASCVGFVDLPAGLRQREERRGGRSSWCCSFESRHPFV